MWNYFIRFFIQQFPTMYISVLINLTKFSFDSVPNKIGSYLSFSSLAICLLFPIIVYSLINLKLNVKISDAEFNVKYGTISEGLRPGNESG